MVGRTERTTLNIFKCHFGMAHISFNISAFWLSKHCKRLKLVWTFVVTIERSQVSIAKLFQIALQFLLHFTSQYCMEVLPLCEV